LFLCTRTRIGIILYVTLTIVTSTLRRSTTELEDLLIFQDHDLLNVMQLNTD